MTQLDGQYEKKISDAFQKCCRQSDAYTFEVEFTYQKNNIWSNRKIDDFYLKHTT